MCNTRNTIPIIIINSDVPNVPKTLLYKIPNTSECDWGENFLRETPCGRENKNSSAHPLPKTLVNDITTVRISQCEVNIDTLANILPV